jgi:hypothetical protein
MDMHRLPREMPPEGLLPATTYVAIPQSARLELHGIGWAESKTLQAAFFTTREMLNSLRIYVETLNTAGFKKDHIGLDIDGKHKFTRNGWVLISYGSRSSLMLTR